MDWAVDQKLLDKVLIRKGLNQPQTETNIALESISDERNIVWQNQSIFGPERHREEEGNHELESFELVELL
jgi:hypothetical protein